MPKRAVAITFDDGYADVFDTAYPVLKTAGVRATVFIPSDVVENKGEFWWDRVVGAFSTEEPPKHSSLHIRG